MNIHYITTPKAFYSLRMNRGLMDYWKWFAIQCPVYSSNEKKNGKCVLCNEPVVIILLIRLIWWTIILGCLWLLVFVLNNILILGIWCSTIPHLPGCFCPWTFFENIGFNTVLTDPFMSHLATQLGYSAGEFQALQLIVLAAFGVVD